MRPTYAAAFQCIGAACEDHCCGDWDIPVDKETYGKYLQFPQEKLGSIVSRYVSVRSPQQPDSLYALIHRAPDSPCPFFGADRLCSIQREYGPPLLSATCSLYPRSLNRVAGELEGSLSLSCPEAARNVLLSPDFIYFDADLLSGDFRTDNYFHLASDQGGPSDKPSGLFLILRRLLIDLIRDRSRPMWYRVLIIGSLCEQLDKINPAEPAQAFANVIDKCRDDFEAQVYRVDIETLPSRVDLKLEIIFGLTDSLMRDAPGSRFRDTFWTFVEGIGTSEASTHGSDTDRFLQAEERYHRPFFERYPFILENYLMNYMFRNLFPYGRLESPGSAAPGILGQYIRMATHFSWINSLLIGIAGRYGPEFSGEHVVKTVQSFTRAIEHYPGLLNSIDEYIKFRELANLRGMAIMLRT